MRLAEAEVAIPFTPEEQYVAQERFDLLREKLDEYPLAIGVTDDIGKHSEDGLYISPDLLLRADELPKFIEMRLLPGAFIGAGDSQHGVMFAQTVVSAGNDKSDLDIAIKPYDEVDEAIYEHDSLIAARELGFESLDPLAIFKDGEKAYLMTSYRPDIISMDTVDWTISPRDERFDKVVVPNLEFVAKSLAIMQAKGLFRSDTPPKNFVKNDKGDMVIIDLEGESEITDDPERHLELLTGTSDGSVNAFESKAVEELKNLWYLLTRNTGANPGNILLPDAGPEEILACFKEKFFPVYEQEILDSLPESILSKIDIEEFGQAVTETVERASRF